MKKPYKIRCWKPPHPRMPGRLFTCGRPGREKGPNGDVPDKLVRDWVDMLPGGKETVIVSLLGRKPDGRSEYDFYSFHGDVDALERPESLHFREWLAREYPDGAFVLEEYPTTDFQRIPDDQLSAISKCVNEHMEMGRTVVLFDSGGEQRTTIQVCERYMGLAEDTTWRPDQS